MRVAPDISPAVAPVRYPQYPSGVVSASTEGYATAPRAVPRKPARTIVSICFAKALGTALQKLANGSTTRQRAAVGRQRFGLLSKSGLPCGAGRSTTGGAAQELIAPVAETTGSTAQEHGGRRAGGRRAAQQIKKFPRARRNTGSGGLRPPDGAHIARPALALPLRRRPVPRCVEINQCVGCASMAWRTTR